VTKTKTQPASLRAMTVWHFKEFDHALHVFHTELLNGMNRNDNFSVPSSHNQLFKLSFIFYYNDFLFHLEIDFT